MDEESSKPFKTLTFGYIFIVLRLQVKRSFEISAESYTLS